VPVLCLDELGYLIPSKEDTYAIFQIVSKRTEMETTIVTTNLVPSVQPEECGHLLASLISRLRILSKSKRVLFTRSSISTSV
jgi:DNA replication protein DnaC